jgi:hypothetical protein
MGGCSPRVLTQERLSDGGDAGRPRVDCDGASGRTPMSADPVNKMGWGQTVGCPTLLAKRRSSPRQRARQRLNGGHRTNDGPWRAARSSLGTRAERERGRGCSAEGATERGRASECGRAPEKARARAGMARKHVVVGASTVESVGGWGRFRQAGPRGQRERTSERAARLTNGARGTAREGMRTRRSLAPTSRPH